MQKILIFDFLNLNFYFNLLPQSDPQKVGPPQPWAPRSAQPETEFHEVEKTPFE